MDLVKHKIKKVWTNLDPSAEKNIFKFYLKNWRHIHLLKF